MDEKGEALLFLDGAWEELEKGDERKARVLGREPIDTAVVK